MKQEADPEKFLSNLQSVELGSRQGYRGDGYQGGEAGGKRYALCIEGSDFDIQVTGTERTEGGPIINEIFNSFKFTN